MVLFDEIRLNPNDSCGENGVLTTEKNTYNVEIKRTQTIEGINGTSWL